MSQTIQKNLNSGLDGTPFVTTHFPQLVKVWLADVVIRGDKSERVLAGEELEDYG